MEDKIYSKIPKWALIIIALLAIIIIVFVARFVFVKDIDIPAEFLTARNEASLIAQDIVNLSDESAKKIEEISRLSNEEKYDEALNLVSEEINRNRTARSKAIALSSELQKMTLNTVKIESESSARLALEAITIETTIINRLISYNDNLTQLLEILRAKLLGQERDSRQKIADLVKKLNDEAEEVNAANQKFNEIMDRFDNSR